ncbi:unnamed protein product [Lepeophtheirus salmonis]|uniref:(salmon louse) hypothetical protein n=1 Tax=Lepeophtheirus salmonis TaxID=72036 RepID=A0A817FD83_LEPSM|nr:unnamed protein product [Lepeophtheirus salmonis]
MVKFLVENVEEIGNKGKKKAQLIAIIRNHLSECGCDPKDFDFATSGPTSSWMDDFNIYASFYGEMSAEIKKVLLLHCARVEVQHWFKTLSVFLELEENEFQGATRVMSKALSTAESVLFESFRVSEI